MFAFVTLQSVAWATWKSKGVLSWVPVLFFFWLRGSHLTSCAFISQKELATRFDIFHREQNSGGVGGADQGLWRVWERLVTDWRTGGSPQGENPGKETHGLLFGPGAAWVTLPGGMSTNGQSTRCCLLLVTSEDTKWRSLSVCACLLLSFFFLVFSLRFRFAYQGYLLTVGPARNHYGDLSVIREAVFAERFVPWGLCLCGFSEVSQEELSSFWAVVYFVFLLCLAVFTQNRDEQISSGTSQRREF